MMLMVVINEGIVIVYHWELELFLERKHGNCLDIQILSRYWTNVIDICVVQI